jgi:hypothetical protein
MEETPTADDYASIDRAADELQRRGWVRRYSLDEAIDDWSSLVDTVEIGYTLTIDDYTNDVSVRQWGGGTSVPDPGDHPVDGCQDGAD